MFVFVEGKENIHDHRTVSGVEKCAQEARLDWKVRKHEPILEEVQKQREQKKRQQVKQYGSLGRESTGR